jgi:hypothetical protein
LRALADELHFARTPDGWGLALHRHAASPPQRGSPVDPKTKMLVPVGLTPDDIDNMRMFVWKTWVEAKVAAAGGASTARNVVGER